MSPPARGQLDLSALFDAYQKRLLALVLRITGDFSLAEDALQQTFLRAHVAARSFRGDSTPATWLYRIAVREAVRLRTARGVDRERARRRSVDQRTGASSGEWRERTERLLAALDELPEEQRMAFILLSARDIPAGVVSELLGVPPATVYTRAFRARRALREKLAGLESEGEGS